ncbi:MAG: ATP-binding protein [Xanthomonadaceae bacterium]|nr:ATP-binding protein [Xanthomonadaceae bacterium]
MSGETWTCPEHGIEYGDGKPDPRQLTWTCPACEREAQCQQREFEAAHRRHRWWDRNSGIPARYRAATPASIQPLTTSAKALARAVEGYTADLKARYDAGDGLLLIGPPGLGKTLALASVINAACDWRGGCAYAVWPDLLAELKAGFSGPKDDDRRQAIERLRDVPFLALDELGVRGMSDFDHGELFALVDYRYRETLPTLVAANATPANFPTMVGERVSDRLKETCAQIVVAGDSLRGRVAITGPDALTRPPEELIVRTHSHGQWRDRKVYAPDEGRFRA